MDWGTILSLGGALAGAASSGNSQQTQNKDPWGPAQGWLGSNLGLGQSMQGQYLANPLSDYQKQAYANSAGLSNTGRAMGNSLLKQISSNQFFDRSNPLVRQTPLNFVGGDTSAASGAPASYQGGFTPITGNLGFTVNPVSSGAVSGGGGNNFGSGVQSVGSHSPAVMQRTPGWYDTTTPSERMDFFAQNPNMAALTAYANGILSKSDTSLIDQAKALQYANEAKGISPVDQSSAETARLAAAEAAASGSPSGLGSMSGGSPDSNSESTNAAMAASLNANGYGGGGGESIKGGLITKKKVAAPRTDGSPDNAYISAHTGEAVLNQQAVKKYGMGMINKMNRGLLKA